MTFFPLFKNIKMSLARSISLVRYVLSLLCPEQNTSLFFVYLTFKYILEVDRRRNNRVGMFGSSLRVKYFPKRLQKYIVHKNLSDIAVDNEHQIVVSTEIFNSLYEENIFFRDQNSLWTVAKISQNENSHYRKKHRDDIATVKSFVNKELCKNILKTKVKNVQYAKSSNNSTEIERIVQIVPCEKLKENEIFVSNIEFFNLQTALDAAYLKDDVIRMRFLPIKHITLAPSVAKKIVVQMVKLPMHIGTDLTDILLKAYFETPKFLHNGDYFEIPFTIEYTRNLCFKYLNLVKHIRKVCFKCKIYENEGYDAKGYFVIKGETELIQEASINSFLPKINNYCKISNDLFDDVNHISELFYGSCPFGLDEYANKLKIAIEPFLIEKGGSVLRNELKFMLNSIFLMRGDIESGCNLLPLILAEQTGLNFIPMNCYQLISSTAKQTEAKLDALIQKAKDVAPVLIYLENFEIFVMNAENEEDIRITASFVNKINDLFLIYDKYPIIFIAGCSNDTELKPNILRIFLEEFYIKKMTSKEKLQLLKWIIIKNDIYFCNNDFKILKNEYICLHKKTIENNSDDEIKNVQNNIVPDNTVPDIHEPITINTQYDCELCRCKKYYDEILEKVISKTEGMDYSDINSLICLVLQESYVSQIEIDNHLPLNEKYISSKKLIREVDIDKAIKNLHSLQNRKMAPLKIPKVHWDDIGGLEDLKKEIIRTIELPLRFPHLFAKSGLKRSGILLWGPPGCGKTLVARAIASQLNANFLSIKGPELLDMYVGQSEKNMREVFATARNSAPCVIFFDEAEAVASSRGATGDSGGAADRLVSQLLAELDGVASIQTNTPNAAVIVVAATNRPDLVEPALMRPGRIDKLIYVGPYIGIPDKVRVLKASSRKFNLDETVSLETVASKLPEKCTGADLSSIINQGRHEALVRTVHDAESGLNDPSKLSEKDVMIENKDFDLAIENFVPSISPEEMFHYESLKTKLL